MTIREHRHEFERWLNATQDLSPHTVDAYVSDVLALERFLGAHVLAEDLTAAHIYRFVDHLSSSRTSSMTIRRRVCGVRSFCAWLVDNNAVPSNPVSSVSLRFARPRRLPRALSESDLASLISHLVATADLDSSESCPALGTEQHVNVTTLIAVLLMVGTGMRVGELTSTTLSQIDFEGRTIRVLGKGLRERLVYVSNDDLIAMMECYARDRITSGQRDVPLLLNRGGDPLTPSALRARLERAGKAAEVRARLTPHILRHTAATQLIESGVDIRIVQRLLGHASLTTTEIYTHVADRSLRDAVNDADVIGGYLTIS